MISTPIEMVRVNTFSFDIAITENTSPVNLTGGTLYFTAKWSPLDADASAVFQLTSTPAAGITVLSASGGTANITIPKTATSTLPYHDTLLDYDLKFIDASSQAFTVMRGKLNVLYNITRT